MCSYSDNDIYGSICTILNKEQFKNFCENNIFGYFIKKKQCVVQAQLCRCIMKLEVENQIHRLLNWKTIAPRPRYGFLTNAMFKDNGKDPPPKKINERSKKKQKVDSSTPVAKKPSGKKTPSHRAAKAAVVKTPVFKLIPTRQASSSQTKEGKQIVRVIFPQVQSKADSHVEEVAVSKRESHVEKETFISKKVFDVFREEVRQEFKGVREEFTRIRQLVKKKFKKMVKAIGHSKQQYEDTEVEAQQMDYAGVETSPQQFSPTVDQNLDENQDGCIDLHPDKTNIEIDYQHLIPDELFQSINLDYNLSENIVHHDDRITNEKLDDTNLSDSESITRHPLATSEEEQIDEHFNDKKSESVVQDHCQENKENIGSSSKADMHEKVDLGMEEQIMTTPKIQELTTDEQRDETILSDSQDTIHDDLLLSLNVYSSKSIIVHPSDNCELQTPIPKLRIRRPSKFKESPYTMKFVSVADKLEGHIRIFPQKHSFIYHPIDGIVYMKIVNKFMDWISKDLIKVHAKRKGNADHYKRGKSTIPMMHLEIETIEDKNWFYTMGFPDQSWTDSHIDVCFYYLRKKSKYDPNRSYKFSTAGGHVAHLNEYINGFLMHAAVPWHTMEDIYIPDYGTRKQDVNVHSNVEPPLSPPRY
ncbi:uncharacterized protein LOC124896591 [Capsicum annuum]|uniref:uncharacterized protein LOC124896591 n=1 Tax=Capsicum annuum TaxID=4072 RepID=UPI001FB18128|nr:uncharacterized protein LOC124896591 [Capsicum annuum]